MWIKSTNQILLKIICDNIFIIIKFIEYLNFKISTNNQRKPNLKEVNQYNLNTIKNDEN